jgi:hypothetical protein
MASKASRVVALAGLGFLAAPGFSQIPSYKGKTITLIPSSGPGDTSDTMLRATVPVLKKHIPGEPAS